VVEDANRPKPVSRMRQSDFKEHGQKHAGFVFLTACDNWAMACTSRSKVINWLYEIIACFLHWHTVLSRKMTSSNLSEKFLPGRCQSLHRRLGGMSASFNRAVPKKALCKQAAKCSVLDHLQH